MGKRKHGARAAADDVAVRADPDGRRIHAGARGFTFHHAYGPDASQREVFLDCVQPLVEGVLDGTSGCCFAFGQTGAGKTHTMIGPDGGGSLRDGGMMQLAAGELFRGAARRGEAGGLCFGGGRVDYNGAGGSGDLPRRRGPCWRPVRSLSECTYPVVDVPLVISHYMVMFLYLY